MRLVLAAFVFMAMVSSASAELCERANGDAYYDNVLDITWAADANLLRTLGVHPSGQMPYGVAESVWIPLLNNQNYLGISTWRIPQWFDQGPEHCNNTFSGTDCGFNMDPMSSENWYNYSVNLGLKSKWAQQSDIAADIQQLPWGTEFADTTPFTNIQIARRYHNKGYCYDRLNPETGEPNEYIGFHYEYGGQHCDGLGSTGFIWPVVDGDVAEGAGDMSTCGNTTIAIDVVPYDAQNQIDPDVDVEVSVAVLATSLVDGDARDFDPTQITPESLRFGPLQTAVINTTPVLEDVDGDLDDDVVYTFSVLDSGIACEDTRVSLIAETASGDSVRGMNDITTPDCETAACHP